MLQPFELFNNKYLAGLIRLKKIYIVTQTYTRAKQQAEKVNILLTDYEDPGLAKIHFNAVKQDPFASIIDLSREKHISKVNEMLSSHSGYILYWSVINDKKFKTKALAKYKDNVRKYILEHTNWRISADADIDTHLELTFGIFYLVIKRGAQKLRPAFEEIEKA